MKKVFIILASLFAVSAEAAPSDWMAQLEQYRTEVQTYSDTQLFLGQFGNYGKAVAGCVGSASLTGIAFISDTIPLTNPMAEWIGNTANARYSSYQDLISWETMANLGRAAAGGGVVGGYESLELIVLWLSGDTSTSFAQLSKVYASSFAALESLFSKESACIMNISRVGIVRAEWRRRAGTSPVMPFTPMTLH